MPLATHLTANLSTDELIYTVPAGDRATCNILLCNQGAAPASVRVALTTGAAPVLANYLEYGAIIPPNGVLERTGIVLQAGEQVYVAASVATVSTNLVGIQETAT